MFGHVADSHTSSVDEGAAAACTSKAADAVGIFRNTNSVRIAATAKVPINTNENAIRFIMEFQRLSKAMVPMVAAAGKHKPIPYLYRTYQLFALFCGYAKLLKRLAPRAGFEPATNRLTAGCSTAELPGNTIGGYARRRDGPIPNVLRHCKDIGPAIALRLPGRMKIESQLAQKPLRPLTATRGISWRVRPRRASSEFDMRERRS